jgi:hypothetical protein
VQRNRVGEAGVDAGGIESESGSSEDQRRGVGFVIPCQLKEKSRLFERIANGGPVGNYEARTSSSRRRA